MGTDTPLADPDFIPPASSSHADEPLTCPLCDYDLRGLPNNRCPECGHAFDPDELRRARAEKREWMFEEVRGRLMKAFVRTSALAFLPWLFWKRLQPAQPIVAKRLKRWALIWFLAPLLLILATGGFASVMEYHTAHSPLKLSGIVYTAVRDPNGRIMLQPPLPGQTPTPAYVSWGMKEFTVFDAISRGFRSPAAGAIPLLVMLLWPITTFAAMNVFRITLRRAGVRVGHLWRCVLYAMPVLVVPMMLAALVSAVVWHVSANPYLSMVVAVGPLAFLLAFILALGHGLFAHTRYLRLPHAIGQAILVQVVAWLSILAIFALPETVEWIWDRMFPPT